MKLEAAILHATMENYKDAASLFEAVASEYVNNNLLKYSAKDHFMNALLCWMADGDVTSALQKRETFEEVDVQFAGSRQDNLVHNCLNAMLASKPDDFATAVAEWESMTKLEPFRVRLLLAAKETIAIGAPDVLEQHGGDDDFLT
jgi:alpha-soluble NSF attachment protein